MKIVLIGFMATGKSTAAPLIAQKLGLNVVEMDDLIIQKAGGKSIEAIFAAGGETAFRELEATVAEELANANNTVISTGGGVVMSESVMKALTRNSVVVELFASFDTVLSRISPAMPRPLFQNADQAKSLYQQRQPLYSKYATIRVATDNKSIDEVVDEVTKQVTEVQNP